MEKIHKKTPTELYFNKLASVYDKATSKPGAWMPPIYVAKEIENDRNKYKTALIVGAGTGQEINILKTINLPHIEGIDISSNMVEQAISKFPDTQLHCGDFMTFNGFQFSSYDFIICSGTLEFISDFSGFFIKCSRLLATSGEMIVTYEPIILGHKIQHEAQSEISPEVSKEYGVRGFITYRHGLGEFLAEIKKAKFHLEKFFEFVAYHKIGTDIIYHFARLKK